MSAYTKAVEKAAKALVTATRGDEANWVLARLTWENTNRRGQTERVSHDTWSADIRTKSGRRFSKDSSKRYAMMWETFGEVYKNTLLDWTECWYELTPREAPKPMRARAAQTHVAEGTPEEVAATVAKALERPEVARRVTANRQSNTALAKASLANMKEAAAAAEAKPGRREQRQSAQRAKLAHDLHADVMKYLNWPNKIDWSEDDPSDLIEAVEEVKMALDGVVMALTFEATMKELTA